MSATVAAPATTAPARSAWHLAVLSFVPPTRRHAAERWTRRAPAMAVLVLQVALTLRLHNVIFNDEGLYINAGHEYLRQFSGGPPAPSYYGGYFSGFPMAYPVVAATVDSVGGLELVRLTSLLLMLAATVAVGAIGARLAPPASAYPARLAAMLLFVLTGAVLFVGRLATYDAACMSLLAISAALVVARRGYPSAVAGGLVFALAGICKYSAATFLPAVAALAVLAALPWRRALLRAGLFAAYAVLGLLAVYIPFAADITPGIRMTTSNRVALNARPLSLLFAEFARGIGILLVLAVVALLLLAWRAAVRRDAAAVRTAATAVVLLAAGLVIPAGQFRLHEYVSFNKHLTFAAIFLAPLAAQTVTVRARVTKPIVAAVTVYVLAVMALYRSEFMFTEWPDTTAVSRAVAEHGRPGTYLAFAASTMAYYAKDRPDMQWEEYWALFGAGRPAIKAAIDQDKYVGVTFVSGSSGDADLDASTAYLADLLAHDPDYKLAGSWPKHRYDANRFYLYLRTTPARG